MKNQQDDQKFQSRSKTPPGNSANGAEYYFGNPANPLKRPRKLTLGTSEGWSTKSKGFYSGAEDPKLSQPKPASHKTSASVESAQRNVSNTPNGAAKQADPKEVTLLRANPSFNLPFNVNKKSRVHDMGNVHMQAKGNLEGYTKESFISKSSGMGSSQLDLLKNVKRSVPNLLISNKVGLPTKSRSRPANFKSDTFNIMPLPTGPNTQPAGVDPQSNLPALRLKDAAAYREKYNSLERVVTQMCNSKYLDELEARQAKANADVFMTAAPLGVSSAHQLRRLVDNKRQAEFKIEQAASKVSVSKKMNAPRVMERWLSPSSKQTTQQQYFLKDLSAEEKTKTYINNSLRLLNPQKSSKATIGKTTGEFSNMVEQRELQLGMSTGAFTNVKPAIEGKLRTEMSDRAIVQGSRMKHLISIQEVKDDSTQKQNRESRFFGPRSPTMKEVSSPRARKRFDSPQASRELSKETSNRSKEQLRALHDPSYFKYVNTVEQRQQRNLMTIRLNATATLLKKMYQQYRVEGQQMLAHLNEEEIRKHARKMEKVLRERRFKDRDLACTQFGQAIHEQNEKLEEMINFLREKYKPV